MAAITNLTGKIIKGRIIRVIEALPLSNKGFLYNGQTSHFKERGRVRS